MVIKVGINSFGRIGRVIFRSCCENSEIEVAAINDPAIDLGYMCYLIKFDSTHGKYTGSVSHEGDEIKVNNRPIKVFHHKTPADVPWHVAGVQYVVEASGMFTSVEKASGHMNSNGVRRVIVTAPSADGPMLILGVNEEAIHLDMKVVSCASSTLYCLAPIMKVLEDAFGVADGFVTSIHAMTPSLKPLDGLCVRGKHWRDHRSIHQNIIPASTGACRALGRIIPACKDKLAGLAFRVPVVSVSVLDMSVRLNKNTTIDEITQIIEKLKNTALGNIIRVSNEKTVSSDFIGETHSCILDIDSSLQLKPNFFKLICWYENEYSYSCRVVDTIIFSERQFQTQLSPPTRVMFMRPISFDSSSHQHTENLRKQFLSICVPTTRSNMTSCSHSFIMRPNPGNGSPKYQLGHSTHMDKKAQSFKSYIDRFTNCNCNMTQKKTRVLETRKGPPRDKQHEKTNGCLKKIEKEISEMLNMTENLLNKSCKLQSVKHGTKKSSTELSEQRSIMRKSIIAKISDTLEKIKQEKLNAQNIEMNGDNNSLTLDVDDYRDKVSLSPCENDSLNNSHLKLPMYSSRSHIINKIKNMNSNVAVEKSTTWLDWDSTTSNLNHQLSETNKSHLTKEIKTLVENKTNIRKDNIEYVKCSSLKNLTVQKVNDSESEIKDNIENEIELWNVIPEENKNVNDTSSNNLYGESDNSRYSGIQSNTHVNKEVSTPVFVVSHCDTDRKVQFASRDNKEQYVEPVDPLSVNALPETENDNDEIENELADEKSPDNSQNLPGCSSSTVENISESLSGLISNYTATNLNKKTGPCIEDICDKLDSESMSDSDSSFKIREKTSQVIRITDLTYSLEDLPRLDKICRVIEISDELSDKLFSPLDSENYESPPGKTWSFQDLCERIKFDEFCNELFEKPTL